MLTLKLETKAASKDKFSRVLKTETRDVKSNLVPNLLMHRSDVEKPDLEEEHDIDKDSEEDDADEAPTVVNSHNLVPAKRWGVESRNVRKGNVALTKDETANGDNYMEPDTG